MNGSREPGAVPSGARPSARSLPSAGTPPGSRLPAHSGRAPGSRLLLILPVALALTAAIRFEPAPQACLAPRPSVWSAVRDTLWPLIVHRDGDATWAHLEAAALSGQSATWCNPLAADASARSAGPLLYAQYCASCHGDEGRGDGPGAAVADPPPYDFTRPEFAGMREPPGPAVLYAMVTRGIDGTTMRAHGEVLSGWERLAVIAYIMEMPGRAAMQNSRAWADTLRARRDRH